MLDFGSSTPKARPSKAASAAPATLDFSGVSGSASLFGGQSSSLFGAETSSFGAQQPLFGAAAPFGSLGGHFGGQAASLSFGSTASSPSQFSVTLTAFLKLVSEKVSSDKLQEVLLATTVSLARMLDECAMGTQLGAGTSKAIHDVLAAAMPTLTGTGQVTVIHNNQWAAALKSELAKAACDRCGGAEHCAKACKRYFHTSEKASSGNGHRVLCEGFEPKCSGCKGAIGDGNTGKKGFKGGQHFMGGGFAPQPWPAPMYAPAYPQPMAFQAAPSPQQRPPAQ